MSDRLDLEFIKRCNDSLKEEKQTNLLRKKMNSKKMNTNRKVRMMMASRGLTEEDRILIGTFYRNCPEGYEVDHIIPLARGGKHKLENLQYLTHTENMQKGIKLNWRKN